MKNRKIIAYSMFIALGVVLIGLGFTEISDPFWSGMGGALIAVGVIRIVQFFRYRKDEAYREKVAVEMTDERNRFIRNKAWAWSGYAFVLIAAVATVALKIAGQDLLSMAASFAVCLIVVMYCIFFMILNKKY